MSFWYSSLCMLISREINIVPSLSLSHVSTYLEPFRFSKNQKKIRKFWKMTCIDILSALNKMCLIYF